jgi:hypothetical protein
MIPGLVFIAPTGLACFRWFRAIKVPESDLMRLSHSENLFIAARCRAVQKALAIATIRGIEAQLHDSPNPRLF